MLQTIQGQLGIHETLTSTKIQKKKQEEGETVVFEVFFSPSKKKTETGLKSE